MNRKRILLLAFCAVLVMGCFPGCVSVSMSPVGGVVGEGALESYTFPVSEVTEINMNIYCDIRYYAGSSDTVTLQIQPNLREYVVLEESGGVLTIRSTRNISWDWSADKVPILTVTSPTLKGVSLSGAGEFKAYDTITADTFTMKLGGAASGQADLDVGMLVVNMSGAGEFRLSGQADEAVLDMAGAGSLDALFLKTRVAEVNLAGVGMVKVNCSERLRISAGGMGTVEYMGSPNVDISRGGLVSVRKLD
ncbi:MAG: DUF2807 domain-containing protein [Peptococcaceae bacterium]|nr:DUF2807 domain-containing protein [Peptococcaceae bacterium]